MKEQGWLLKYKEIDDLEGIFHMMDRRIKISNLKESISLLHENYDQFSSEFETFFDEIVAYINENITNLE